MADDDAQNPAEGEARWLQMFGYLPQEQREDLLIQAGRRLIIRFPIAQEITADDDPEPVELVRWDWLDDQLARIRPYQCELGSLDDSVYSALSNAWPEGYDKVLFGSSDFDPDHASDLVAAYLECATELALPLMTDFGSTEEEMRDHLTEEFTTFIRTWRDAIMAHFKTQALKDRQDPIQPAS